MIRPLPFAPLALGTLMALASCASRAGIWVSQPDVGVSSDFNSNPALFVGQSATEETHVALLLDAPTTYTGDGVKWTILPSFRISDSSGYSALDSDYEHLNVSGAFSSERDVLTTSLYLAQDSSLFRDYILDGATGVRRDSLLADLDWDRHLSERWEAIADLNWNESRYADSQDLTTLSNYRYASFTPSLAWLESETNKLTGSVTVARYNSLNGATESKSLNVQVGLTKNLTELWTLTASGGYSRANNSVEGLACDPAYVIYGICLPISAKAESSQNGTVFSASLNRQTERWSLTALAARQLLPGGFAYLSRQQSYEIRAAYTRSPRLTFTGDLRRIEYQEPEANGLENDSSVTAANLTAVWQWTEHWIVTLTATRVIEAYGSPTISVGNTGLSVEFSRQFNWKSAAQP